MKLKMQTVSFSGALLERGFWLYVWHITEEKKDVLYVGRTGDSSSQYAASPFNRMGQHLDMREKAPANMLKRNLEKAGLNPLACKFELIAVGPIYEEQKNLEEHRKHRDIVAPLETALALYLKDCGYEVIGNHGKQKPYDHELLKKITSLVIEKLPAPACAGVTAKAERLCENSVISVYSVV